MLYDSKKMCDKAVNSCFFVSIPDQYKTQEMCDTIASENPSLIAYWIDKYKTQRIFDSVVSEDHSLIAYWPDKYKTQGMSDEPVNDYLAALRLVSDWFITSKIITNLFIASYADESSTLIKVLVMPNLIAMEWVLLI